MLCIVATAGTTLVSIATADPVGAIEVDLVASLIRIVAALYVVDALPRFVPLQTYIG